MPENVSDQHYDARCDIDHMKGRAIAARANDELITKLVQISRHRHFRAGQTILPEGVPCDFVGGVVSGVVKLTKFTIEGRHQIVGLLFPSDLVGRSFADCPRVSGPPTRRAALALRSCSSSRRSEA